MNQKRDTIANIMIGAGSILDMFSTLPQRNSAADLDNLRQDWQRVGNYMRDSISDVTNGQATTDKCS